jgi:hypothetical protein
VSELRGTTKPFTTLQGAVARNMIESLKVRGCEGGGAMREGVRGGCCGQAQRNTWGSVQPAVTGSCCLGEVVWLRMGWWWAGQRVGVAS